MLRKLKWQIPREPLAARYNWCQGPVPGRGPAVEKHWFRRPRSAESFRQPGIWLPDSEKPSLDTMQNQV